MKRKIVIFTVCILSLIVGIMVVCDRIVDYAAKDRMYDNVDSIPHRKVGLILGTSPISTWNGRRNYYFDNRINAGAELYKAGKVNWRPISEFRGLISGAAWVKNFLPNFAPGRICG